MWLDKSGYIITQWGGNIKEQAISWFKNWEEQKNYQGWAIL